MSERGKILVADEDGAFLLRFVGDVRLTLCVAIDDYLNVMLGDPAFHSVTVDLKQAVALDSTSLGLLVKLAQETQKRLGEKPLLSGASDGLLRALRTVGVDELFDTFETPDGETWPPKTTAADVSAGIAKQNDDEAAMRERVLEAHRLLMSLNPANADAFRDLVEQLESIESNERAASITATPAIFTRR